MSEKLELPGLPPFPNMGSVWRGCCIIDCLEGCCCEFMLAIPNSINFVLIRSREEKLWKY
jgi:hypothetical protein